MNKHFCMLVHVLLDIIEGEELMSDNEAHHQRADELYVQPMLTHHYSTACMLNVVCGPYMMVKLVYLLQSDWAVLCNHSPPLSSSPAGVCAHDDYPCYRK